MAIVFKIRMKFWRWAHRAAERLWHWIYYYRLPEGIQERISARHNRQGEYRFSCTYASSLIGDAGTKGVTESANSERP